MSNSNCLLKLWSIFFFLLHVQHESERRMSKTRYSLTFPAPRVRRQSHRHGRLHADCMHSQWISTHHLLPEGGSCWNGEKDLPQVAQRAQGCVEVGQLHIANAIHGCHLQSHFVLCSNPARFSFLNG